jgi:photosystem II stability/assembly factor-like uncharacterized protein
VFQRLFDILGFRDNSEKLMKPLSFLTLAICCAATAVAQPALTGLEWRSIGPAATGGRIADLAISKVPGSPETLYVGTTSGGIFKSVNEGVSFTPIFDKAGGMMSIGAVAVSASNPSIVWAGTGEADNRQSSSWGDGVYKSSNGGLTWEKKGLEETRHIGKILIHPTDPNIVYIASVGHLWGSNPERGVFKTTDGGNTWTKVLYKDEHTGAIDLVMDPHDPQVLYAAMYQRQRKGWGFNGGGPGSGIFRTTDGGKNWTELAGGLPAGEKGRIGLSVFAADGRILYAVVEADMLGDPRPGEGEGPPPPAAAGAVRNGIYRSQDRGETWEHMSGLNPRPVYYSRIYVDPKDSRIVYIMGSNRGFHVSEDSGRTFREGVSGVHGEDHVMWVDPDSTNHLIIGGDGGVSISFDRGLTWLMRLNLPIGQFYNIATNNADPYLICGGLQDNGSWCTPSATHVGYGISFKDAFNVGGGDGMHAVFEGDDHTMLVSSQNGVTGRVDLRTMQRQSVGPVQPAEKPKPGDSGYRWYWTTPLIVSQFDAGTIYTGANQIFRSTDRGVSWKSISPDLTGNMDRTKLQMMGQTIPARAFSKNDGQSNFSALTAIAESPLDRNLLYSGSDDGKIQVTRDGGEHWTDLTGNVHGLPAMLNISGIVPSKYAAGRVYLTVDGHFNDDYRPWVFSSEDFGKTWQPIVTGLPPASVHRLREHPANPNFLVVGTEEGAWATFDRGAHWTTLNTNIPPVPVYDLLFQEKEHALVLGTHGRSILILDHIEPLEQLIPEVLTAGNHLFPIPAAHRQTIYGGQFWFGSGEYFAPNPPAGAVVTYSLARAAPEVSIAISDAAGKPIRTLRAPANAGFNRICWDLRLAPPIPSDGPPAMANCAPPVFGEGRPPASGPVVLPGKYTVTITAPDATVMKTDLTLGPDPAFPISDADRAKRNTAIMSAYKLQQQLVPARDALVALNKQLTAMRQYLTAAGDAGKSALAQVEKADATVTATQSALNRTLNSARTVQTAMDAYDGLPTEAQLHQLDWTWEDAAANAGALNKIVGESMPSVYSAIGETIQWPKVPGVAIPTR